jgi:uncharacterized membrane protein (UPF0127 family)
MWRERLADGAGMLFIFPDVEERAFWMQNTLISLDMLFLDEAWRVVGILEAVPPLNREPRSVGKPSRYVLEQRQGVTAVRDAGQRVHAHEPLELLLLVAELPDLLAQRAGPGRPPGALRAHLERRRDPRLQLGGPDRTGHGVGDACVERRLDHRLAHDRDHRHVTQPLQHRERERLELGQIDHDEIRRQPVAPDPLHRVIARRRDPELDTASVGEHIPHPLKGRTCLDDERTKPHAAIATSYVPCAKASAIVRCRRDIALQRRQHAARPRSSSARGPTASHA